MVHDCKLRVDGITKYLDNTDFAFDHAFDETETTEALYHYTAAPLVPFIFQVGLQRPKSIQWLVLCPLPFSL